MAITSHFLETMQGVWASSALTVIPNPPVPNVPYRMTNPDLNMVNQGQRYTAIFESSIWNQMMYLLTGMVTDITRTGVRPWTQLQGYYEGAIVVGTDGKLYRALIETGPGMANPVQNPVTDTDHAVWAIAGGEVAFKDVPTVSWEVLSAAGKREYPDVVYAEGNLPAGMFTFADGTSNAATTNTTSGVVLTFTRESNQELQVIFVFTLGQSTAISRIGIRNRGTALPAWGPFLIGGVNLAQPTTTGILPMAKGGTGNAVGNVPRWNGNTMTVSTAAPSGGTANSFWFRYNPTAAYSTIVL